MNQHATFGHCTSCQTTHSLPQGNARRHCLALMKELAKSGRIDHARTPQTADPCFSTQYLFGRARGQMFGILECEDAGGDIVLIRAFSGQYNGVWEVEDWAPPLLNVKKFDHIVPPVDRNIKTLGREIAALPPGPARSALIQQRKKLSQDLMKQIHALYRVHNFRSEVKSLSDLFPGGIPTGTGDCCAPKLLNHAARNNLKPLSLAEFYWGRENRSATRHHGRFYPSCEDKCRPILGFMLCGVNELHA